MTTNQRSSTPSSTSRVSTYTRPPVRTVRTVVTTPPWAQDEPPSPILDPSSSNVLLTASGAESTRPSDVSSLANHPSRWWAFTSRRTRDPPLPPFTQETPTSAKSEKRPFKFPLPPSASKRDAFISKEAPEGLPAASQPPLATRRGRGLSITLPDPPDHPFTLSHNVTPGWDTPWTSRPAAQGPIRPSDTDPLPARSFHSVNGSNQSWDVPKNRKTKTRYFILHNPYVPLLFRLVNFSFTLTALALAIRIRLTELRAGIAGALGPSPTLVIIFAPLTLVHVMAAVYLEYFGRPLGLWRTSGKMFHTLLEVVFICAWSAALSLCFDNYFASPLPCAPVDRRNWYNQLGRPSLEFGLDEPTRSTICEEQLALICLVFTGLLTYCTNLVISLFRIVEKVKYRPNHGEGWRTS